MAGVAAGDLAVAIRTSFQTAVSADDTFGTAGVGMKVKLTGDGEAGLEEAVYVLRPEESIRSLQEHAAMGAGRRNEEITIPGRAQVKATGKASETSATFATALNRARDLMDLLVIDIKNNPPAVGDQTLRSIISDIEYLPIQIDQGWAVVADFDITATARVT